MPQRLQSNISKRWTQMLRSEKSEILFILNIERYFSFHIFTLKRMFLLLPTVHLLCFVHTSHRNRACSKTQRMIAARGSSGFSRYYSPVLTNGRLFRIKSLACVDSPLWKPPAMSRRAMPRRVAHTYTYTSAIYRSMAHGAGVYASFCERSRSLGWKRPFLGVLPRPQIAEAPIPT